MPALRCLGLALVVGFSSAVPAQGPNVVLAPPPVLAAFDLAAATLQTLTLPAWSPSMVVDVVLAGQLVQLSLAPFDVRGPNFQLWERTATGLTAVPSPASLTCRGAIATEPGSAIAAHFQGGGLCAYVQRAAGELWVVQPLAGVMPGAGAQAHVVYRAADSAVPAARCGTAGFGTGGAPGGGTDAVYICQLALEADHPLFLARGSVAATQTDVLGVVNAVDLIYRSDVQVQLQVSQLIVDSTPDPYTSNDAGTLLGQFEAYWNANYGAVPRDIAHLFSARPIGAASGGTIGVAYLAVVCNLPIAYGLSQTAFTNNFGFRVGLTAHEIGHNFAAQHCDGQPGCAIMCSQLGGCASNVGTFSPGERAQILGYVPSASCLQLVATQPQLTAASPPQVISVAPGIVTLTGTGLTGTTSVTIGSTQVNSGFTLQGDTVLRLVPPAGLSLGSKPVSVTNPAGTSNAVLLSYAAADPAQLLVPLGALGGSTLTWTMGGWPGDTGYLGISFVNTTSPFLGLSLLDGFLPLWIGTLDARGMATFAVPVPPGLLTGLSVFSQLLDENAGQGTLRSVSNVRTTTFLN
jgi:hypothetical protein